MQTGFTTQVGTPYDPFPHLVGQEAVCDVAAAEVNCCCQGVRGVDHVVVPLVPLLGVFVRRGGRGGQIGNQQQHSDGFGMAAGTKALNA